MKTELLLQVKITNNQNQNLLNLLKLYQLQIYEINYLVGWTC